MSELREVQKHTHIRDRQSQHPSKIEIVQDIHVKVVISTSADVWTVPADQYGKQDAEYSVPPQ